MRRREGQDNPDPAAWDERLVFHNKRIFPILPALRRSSAETRLCGAAP
jgi:hypothetical protein